MVGFGHAKQPRPDGVSSYRNGPLSTAVQLVGGPGPKARASTAMRDGGSRAEAEDCQRPHSTVRFQPLSGPADRCGESEARGAAAQAVCARQLNPVYVRDRRVVPDIHRVRLFSAGFLCNRSPCPRCSASSDLRVPKEVGNVTNLCLFSTTSISIDPLLPCLPLAPTAQR